MVWFQCEDCGENLKKPKLAVHFNRCSAYTVSCIDCGVVFDQQSVQDHCSCVSEAEKYGPKGLNKAVTGPPSKGNCGKSQNGHDVDFSRGLSTCPPWYCSLCNVKATSRETLKTHAGGKKHQSRCKAADAKEKSNIQGGDTGVAAEMNIDDGKNDDQKVQILDAQAKAAFDTTSLSGEKKRRKERTGKGDDLTSLPSGNLEKKLKLGGTSTDAGISSTEKDDERLLESGNSQDKKRKLGEEDEIGLDEIGQVAGSKKSRKKGKQAATGEVNGHVTDVMDAPKIHGPSSVVGLDGNGEQVKKKGKASRKDLLISPLCHRSLNHSKEQASGVAGGAGVEVSGLTRELLSQSSNGKTVTGKMTKKSKGLPETPDIEKSPDTPGIVQQDHISKSTKKGRKKNLELKEAIVHDVSFREWLGEEDGTQGGTPTHPQRDISRGKGNLEQLEGMEKAKGFEESVTDSTREGIAKVVKWKKIIRGVLGKFVPSLNGKLKRIEFKKAVLPLAQKAVESASISVDRKALKAELMRQVTSSPKFVVDGKHIMLAPNIE